MRDKELSRPPHVLPSETARTLMLRVREGDQEAFRRLYEAYKRPILSYLFQMTQNRTQSEDLAHEVFLRVYRARERYEPSAKFTTWLWTIARNCALDHLRKKKEDLSLDGFEGGEIFSDLEGVESSAEQLLMEQAHTQKLTEAMKSLSPIQREAMSLRIFSELSYQEIAETLGCTVPAVKSALCRAKENLVAKLKEEERK